MRRQEIDHILTRMLDSHSSVSDLNLTVGRPLQVESAGELLPVDIKPPIKALSPFQTETVAMNLIDGAVEYDGGKPLFRSERFTIELPGFCTTCMCKVQSGMENLSARNDKEENMGVSEDPDRLSCQAQVNGDVEVEVLET